MNDMIDCGYITGTHGILGEVKLHCILDEDMLPELGTLYVGGTPYAVVAARPHKRQWLVKLEGVSTVEAAMALKGKTAACRRADLPLPEGHYFYSDIYGFEVYDHRVGQVVGTLSEVRELPASMVYVVETADTLFMIPAVEAFKRGVDFEAKRVAVETIEGMLHDES